MYGVRSSLRVTTDGDGSDRNGEVTGKGVRDVQ